MQEQKFLTHAPDTLRSAEPGVGLGLDHAEVTSYLAAVDAGLVVAETRCDKGMQDKKALMQVAAVDLPAQDAATAGSQVPALA